MSSANSCAFLILFFSLHVIFSTVAPSNGHPPIEKYWYSRLPNTPFPKPLHNLVQPGHYLSMTMENIINTEINYKYTQRKTTIKSPLPDSTIFSFYNDLYPGKKMKLIFTNSGTKANFLPREIAESIPFSSDKIPEILKHFAIEFDSKKAQIISEEIRLCESPSAEGEEKYCATSLESLIDFNVNKFGQNVQVLSTEPGKNQEYTVSAEVKKIGDHKAAACHKLRYPYAVHYCHVFEGTEVFVVPLVGADGSKTVAIRICHMNTAAWSPEHVVFQLLKTKPGPAVCHFPNIDTLVWVPTNDQVITP